MWEKKLLCSACPVCLKWTATKWQADILPLKHKFTFSLRMSCIVSSWVFGWGAFSADPTVIGSAEQMIANETKIFDRFGFICVSSSYLVVQTPSHDELQFCLVLPVLWFGSVELVNIFVHFWRTFLCVYAAFIMKFCFLSKSLELLEKYCLRGRLWCLWLASSLL